MSASSTGLNRTSLPFSISPSSFGGAKETGPELGPALKYRRGSKALDGIESGPACVRTHAATELNKERGGVIDAYVYLRHGCFVSLRLRGANDLVKPPQCCDCPTTAWEKRTLRSGATQLRF